MSNRTAKVVTAARLGLGLIFFVFGLNGFLNFIPQPPSTGNAATFMAGLAASGYLFPLLKGTEVLAGLALLSNRFVPLAVTVLAPIVVNIVAVHLFLVPSGLPVAVVVLAAHLGLAWAHRATFAPLLKSRPATASLVSPVADARPQALAA